MPKTINTNNDEVSEITEMVIGSPQMPSVQLEDENIGLPKPPVARAILMPSPDKIEQGYDSDGWNGPCFEAVSDEGALIWNEEEVIPTDNDPKEYEEQQAMPTEEECRAMKVSELRDQLALRNLSKNGRKAELLQRLLTAIKNNLPLIANANPEKLANMAGAGFAPTAHWELIDPGDEEVNDSLVDTDGHVFYHPTADRHPNEAVNAGPVKKNYNEQFDRQPFVQNAKVPIRNSRGKIRHDNNGNVLYHTINSSDTLPNIDYLHRHNISVESSPKEWFNLFLPVHRRRQDHPDVFTLEEMTTWTNRKAYLSNAGEGGSNYSHWKPFSIDEVQKHLGIYIFNGLSPSPQVTMKFNTQEKDPVNGNDFVASAFGVNAVRRHKEFKAFFACADPLLPTPSRKTHPNWKVQKFFKWAMYISKKCVVIGKQISCDEQTIGFQGRHPDVLRISYKKEGDGFQCDAICADGYTYCFYFRNQVAPKCFLDLGMSPLHARVHSLWDQLPSKYYACAIDNLYMSTKFCRSAWRCKQKVMIYGVARSDNRGVPKCVHQVAVTKKSDLEQARGTLKVAHLKGDEKIPGLVALSYYDSKPFYMLSNSCEKVQWVEKERKIWRKDTQTLVTTKFYRLNIIDDYNNNMNNVDVADQLRGAYRFDRFVRLTKWWWSMYFWCFQMLLTNSYVLYKKYMLLHDMKPLSHYDFQTSVAKAWVRPDLYLSKNKKIKTKHGPRRLVTTKSVTIANDTCTRASLRSATSDQDSVAPRRSTGFTNKTLHPINGVLKIRLTGTDHWPVPTHKKDGRCQLHFWATGKKCRSQLLECTQCKVTLCAKCFVPFHTVEDLVGSKKSLQMQYMTTE